MADQRPVRRLATARAPPEAWRFGRSLPLTGHPLQLRAGTVRCLALDLPGFGRSAGELDVEQACVPDLAGTVLAGRRPRRT